MNLKDRKISRIMWTNYSKNETDNIIILSRKKRDLNLIYICTGHCDIGNHAIKIRIPTAPTYFGCDLESDYLNARY